LGQFEFCENEMPMHIRLIAMGAAAIVAVAGCSQRPSRLVPPDVSSNAGSSAIEKFDADKNGSLDGKELGASPALKSAVARIDKDGDAKLTAAEIDERIQTWRDSRVALTSVMVTVRLDGRPLVGADVSFEPEPILGDEIEVAKGTTNDQGMARIRVSETPEGRGVRPGLYRIRISKLKDGKEQLPARYSQGTELGAEVVSDVFATRNPVFNLTSR
jgi:hypothetical protein